MNGVRILKYLPAVVFEKFVDKDGLDVPWTVDGLKELGLSPSCRRRVGTIIDGQMSEETTK